MKIRIEIEAYSTDEYQSILSSLYHGATPQAPRGHTTNTLDEASAFVRESVFAAADDHAKQTPAPAPQQEAKPRGRGRPPKDQAEAHAAVSTPAAPATPEVAAPGIDVRAKLLAATAGEVKYETMADVVKTIMMAKSASAAQGAIFEATGGTVGSLASFKDNKAAWPELFDKLVAWCEKEGVAL